MRLVRAAPKVTWCLEEDLENLAAAFYGIVLPTTR